MKYLLGEICGSCSDKVIILTPFPGWNEIDPEDLWNKIVKVRNIYDCQEKTLDFKFHSYLTLNGWGGVFLSYFLCVKDGEPKLLEFLS